MKTLFDEIEQKTYKGYTEQQYRDVVKKYSDAMFTLFETDKSYATGNLSLHLMWLGSWTSNYIARDVVDCAEKYELTLEEAFMDVLIQETSYGRNDLEKIKKIMLEI